MSGKYDAYKDEKDEDLLRRLRSGESEIADYLVDKYKYLVRQKARPLYLAGGDQEDLIQEGMLGLFKAIQGYQEDKETAFSTFAALCIDRQMYSAISMSQRQKHQPLNSFVSLSEPVSEQELRLIDEETPEVIMISRESVDRMHEKIREILSPFEYQVLELYLCDHQLINNAFLNEDTEDKIIKYIFRLEREMLKEATR